MSGVKSTTRPVSMVKGFWLDRGLHKQLADLARENERTIVGEVRVAIRNHLAKETTNG